MGLCLQSLRSDFPCNSGWMVFFSNRLGVMSWSKLLMPDFLLCCCLSQWFGYGNLVSTANWLWNTTEYVSNGGCPTWASLAKEYPKFRRVVDHPIPSWTEIVVASPTYRHPQVRLQRLNFPQEIHCFFSASGAFNAALAKDARAAWTAKARDDDGHLLLGRKSDGDHQALDLDAQSRWVLCNPNTRISADKMGMQGRNSG